MRFRSETIKKVLEYIDKLQYELRIPNSNGYYGPM